MADKIRVTPEKLKNTASVIESDILSRYNGLVNQLYSEVIPGIKNADKGAATDAFVQRTSDFKHEFENMGALIKKYADFLNQAADRYIKIDNQKAGDAAAQLSRVR